MTDAALIPIGSTSSPSATARPAAAETAMDAFSQDKELFLKLLVAQLKYQDPTSPAKPQEFLAQTAQFTMVDNLSRIAKGIADAAITDRVSTAANLVGKTVTWDGGSGTVDSVRFREGRLQVVVGDVTVDIDYLTEITDTVTAPDPSPDNPAGTGTVGEGTADGGATGTVEDGATSDA